MTLSRSISWVGAAQIVSFALALAASVVLARILTVHDMGVYAVAVASVGVLSLIQALGLRALIIREEVLSRDLATTAFTINCVLSAALSALIAGSSFIGGAALRDDGVRRVILALALTPVLSVFEFLPAAQLEREGRFKALSAASILSTLCSTSATIGFAITGQRYMSAVYAGWVYVAVNAIIVNLVGRRHVSFAFGTAGWRRVAEFGFQMLATSGIHSLGERLTDLILARTLGIPQLGLYSRASNLNGLIWNNVHVAVGRVMFVDFASLFRDGVSLRARYLSTVEVITAVLWPTFAGLGVIAGPLIFLVYGERWVPSAPALSVLAVASMTLVSITMTWEVFAATGNLRAQTKIESFVATFSALAFTVLSRYGLAAAAASRVASACFALFMYAPHLKRMTGIASGDLRPVYCRSALLTLLAVSPAATVMMLFGFSYRAPIVYVALAVLTGVALWFCGLLGLRHRILDEVRRAVTNTQPAS